MATSDPAATQTAQECPSQAILKEYLYGKTDETLGGQIDLHLENCQACNNTLQALESQPGPKWSISEEQILQAAIAEAKLPVLLREIPTMIGPYRLEKSIGRGGMGEVYRAEHIKLKKTVAIKLLPLYLANANAVERFEREIQAAGKLSHPAIINSTDAGIDAGYQYLAMEYIEGVDLGRLQRRLREIPFADVCEIGRQMALGLAHAHSMGMVHRDIKPSNVMLDSSGNVKLLDFGLVLLSQWDNPVGELTTVGQFLGTLDYMAPEQAERSASVDHHSDLYSLGVTLFRLLTGQLPLVMLPNHSPLEKLKALTNHSPIRIQTLRKDLPGGLSSLIDQLLRTDPKDRPASAAHVAEALEPFCQGADLRRLATRAAEAAGQDDASEDYRNAIRRPPTSLSREQANASWWMIAIAACLPLAAYLGFTVILEDSNGNLVIQSEVDQVHVRLVTPDGKPQKEWHVEQGNSITRLSSGSYEITIDSPSDTVTIDKSTLDIRKGETIVAKISRQAVSTATVQSSSHSSTPWLPANSVPDSILESTYQGKHVIDYLKSIHVERSYDTWNVSLVVLERTLPSECKLSLSRFVIDSAREKQFINLERVLRLSDWMTDESIDETVHDLLSKSNNEQQSRIQQFVNRCVSDQELNAERVIRRIDYTKLKKTWSFIEDWLGQGDIVEQQELLRLSVTKLDSRILLSDFLFAQYPRTAFAICNYYDYKQGAFGMTTAVLKDTERRAIRLNSLLKRSREAFERHDIESLFYYIPFMDKNPENVSAEAAYWNVTADQIRFYLKAWAARDQPVLTDGVRIRLAAYTRHYSIDIIPAAANQWIAAMGGGYGGGMGGMGGMATGAAGLPGAMTIGLPPNGKAKTSQSVELLAAYESLPEEFRPKEAMEEVRAMLAKHLGDTTARSSELFPMEWSQLRWNDQYQLRIFGKNGKLESFRPEDQQAVEAFVLHRWVSFLLDSDEIEPGNVCNIFFQKWTDAEGSEARSQAKQWIVSRGREKWAASEPKYGTAYLPGFNAEVINYWVCRATVTGRNDDRGQLGVSGLPITFELELEKEGWRIRKLVKVEDNHERVVFEY